MSFTKSTTDISVHQKLGDYPNQDNGMTADELKKKFDYPAETLQKDLNKIVEELGNENATQSIGASKLDENDETENNVQAKLDKVYTEFKQVRDGGLKDNSIEASKLKDEAITTEKIVDSAITTAKILDNAVTTEKIANLAVTNTQIANGSITGEKVDANVKKAENITAEKININDTSEGNVQSKLNKLYEDMVDMSQGTVADNSISTAKIVNGSVTKEKTDFELFLVPSGFIGMWSGNVIPNGWYLCDGTNGTPDLRDRFIVGSGNIYSIGGKGGSASVTLEISQMPSHSHSMSSDGEHTHTLNSVNSDSNYAKFAGFYASGASLTARNSRDRDSYVESPEAGEHTHSIALTGGGQAHENRPPYYALAFIMKA